MDEIQTKVLRVFLLAIHSHLYSFALDLYFFKLTQPLTGSTVHLLYMVKEKGGKPDRKPYRLPMVLEIHTETSSLRTLRKPQRNCTFKNCFWANKVNFTGAVDQGLYCNDETISSASSDTLSNYLYYVLLVINTVQLRNILHNIHPLKISSSQYPF